MTIESKANIFSTTLLSLNFLLTNLPIVKRGFFSTYLISHLKQQGTSTTPIRIFRPLELHILYVCNTLVQKNLMADKNKPTNLNLAFKRNNVILKSSFTKKVSRESFE